MKKYLMILLVIIVFVVPVAASDVLTNDSVVSMVEIGLDEELVISKIQNSKCDFDTSTEDLMSLSEKGISKKIIKAMIEAGNSTTKEEAYPFDEDIFYQHDGNSKEIPPVNVTIQISNRRSWIPVAGGYMGPEHFHFINGEEAQLQIYETKPVFITRCDPSRIKLVHLGYSKRKEKRYVVFKREQSDREIQFETEVVDEGTYKITPSRELDAGEYAFIVPEKMENMDSGMSIVAALAQAQGLQKKAYDFGIKERKNDP